MTLFIGTSEDCVAEIRDEKSEGVQTNDTTQTLNFSSVSKHLSFNEGNKEGYYKVRPKAIRPSDHNPRPDWIIDDEWLVKHVGIDMEDVFENEMGEQCLVRIKEIEKNGKMVEEVEFSNFDALRNSPDESQRKEYEFLVQLAKSIREVGQIQPIEIESDPDGKVFVVLEGHLRRLACILGRVRYIKAIRNEGLHNLSRRDKIGRQITENSLRSNVSLYGNYKLSAGEINENKKISSRELSHRLKIQKNVASVFIKLISNPDNYHEIIYKALEGNLFSSRTLTKACSYRRKDMQESFVLKIFKKNKLDIGVHPEGKARGVDGRKKTVASFRVKSVENCVRAGGKLLSSIPELSELSNVKEVKSVDDMIAVLKSLEEFLLNTSNEGA